MIYFRSSIFFILSIAYLIGFSTTAAAQDSQPNHDLSSSKLTSQTVTEELETTSITSNKMLLLLAMGATSVIAAITLYFVFQPDSNSDKNKSAAKSSQKPVTPKSETETLTIENPTVEILKKSLTSVDRSQENLDLPLPSTIKVTLNSDSSMPQLTTETITIVKQQNQTIVSGLKKDDRAITKESLAFDFDNTLIHHSVVDDTAISVQTKTIDLVFELIQDLQKSNETTRYKAIWELAQKSDSRAIAPLIRLIPQANSAEKSLILEAITQITNRSIKSTHKVLLDSFHDPNPQVRKNAIRDSTILYQLTSEVTRHLAQLLEDTNPEVRQTAHWAWKQLNLPSSRSRNTLPEIANNQDNLTR